MICAPPFDYEGLFSIVPPLFVLSTAGAIMDAIVQSSVSQRGTHGTRIIVDNTLG